MLLYYSGEQYKSHKPETQESLIENLGKSLGMNREDTLKFLQDKRAFYSQIIENVLLVSDSKLHEDDFQLSALWIRQG